MKNKWAMELMTMSTNRVERPLPFHSNIGFIRALHHFQSFVAEMFINIIPIRDSPSKG
jgi:hypothetical protein